MKKKNQTSDKGFEIIICLLLVIILIGLFACLIMLKDWFTIYYQQTEKLPIRLKKIFQF